jgi:short-subunit dehydrogenase
MTPVLLCRQFIPDMLASNRNCYILNVGSLGGFFHIPNKEVYGATKAFIYSFTQSLQLKLEGTLVSLIVICPGPVETNERLRDAHKNMKGLAKRAVMFPEEVAEKALNALFSGKKVFVPGKVNNLFLKLDWIVPSFIKNRILRKEMKRQASFTR